jgi:hypothetical protein
VGKQYVIRGRFGISGVPYHPLFTGKDFSPVGWAAKVYNSYEEAERDLVFAAACDERAIGTVYIEEKRAS